MAAFMKKLNMIVRASNVYRGERVTAEGFHGAHHSYARAILKHPGLSQDELAERLCAGKSTVARVLAKLEEHGYVERRTSETDRRVLCVYPTARMRELEPAVLETAREWNGYLFGDLSEEERVLFDHLLDRITARAMDYTAGKDGPRK